MPERAQRNLIVATMNVERARAELVKAMRQARDAGMSYRKIGELTHLSHQTIWRMLGDE